METIDLLKKIRNYFDTTEDNEIHSTTPIILPVDHPSNINWKKPTLNLVDRNFKTLSFAVMDFNAAGGVRKRFKITVEDYL